VAKFVDRLADAASYFRQPFGPKNQQSDNDDDQDMDRLNPKWHDSFLSTLRINQIAILLTGKKKGFCPILPDRVSQRTMVVSCAGVEE
jgi:hypothetical protein